jgi:drug/metabolite transporter (DMT)-like permease
MGLGEICSLAAAATWALGVIAYKRLGETLPPRRLNLFKNTLVLALILPTAWYLDGLAVADLDRSEILLCLLSGFLGIGLADTLYFRALNALGAGHMGVVGNLYSPLMILLAFVFLGERLSLQQGIGFALVASGVMVVSLPEQQSPSDPARLRMVLTAALSILLMATSIIMVKRTLEQHSVLWISTLRVGGGVAGLLVLGGLGRLRQSVAEPAPRLSRNSWALLIAAALIGQFVSMLLWLYGYKYTSASVAAVLNECASVFIVLFAWILLREAITQRRLLGVALALAGVVCMLV